jgi:hypothetical protein
MKKFKKSAAGPVVLQMLSDGVNKGVSKGSSVKTAVFYLPQTRLNSDLKTVLFGLENGFWKGKLMQPYAGTVDCPRLLYKGSFILILKGLQRLK